MTAVGSKGRFLKGKDSHLTFRCAEVGDVIRFNVKKKKERIRYNQGSLANNIMIVIIVIILVSLIC